MQYQDKNKHKNPHDLGSAIEPDPTGIDFDASDFDAPTTEQWLEFYDLLDTVKELAKKEGHLDSFRLDDPRDGNSVKIDGEVNHWIYIKEDERPKNGPRFTCQFTDFSSQEVIDQLAAEGMLSTLPARRISYSDQYLDIGYVERVGSAPSLYIADNKALEFFQATASQNGISSSLGALSFGVSGTPELMQYMQSRFMHKRAAIEGGADTPVQGSLRLLSQKIKAVLDLAAQESTQ